MSFGASTLVKIDDDRVIEGLRVPSTLDSVQNVTFLLTQEPGKLKPKDLKAAIERNRAEKEQRAEEQRKLRAEGGGAGMLDLRGILSEERLNSNEGDEFKRQLREMAFLADVDDVEKLEIEKGFRVSEDYLGSNMLSEEDISIVYKQRKVAMLHKKRAQWRAVQSRVHTGLHPPTHPHIKAGTSADTAKLILSLTSSNKGTSVFAAPSSSCAALTPPHFDPNRNDIWAKRMNSLRSFISLVSKWLIRKRVSERMNRVMAHFSENGCHTRAEIRSFIENSSTKQTVKKTPLSALTKGEPGDMKLPSEESKKSESVVGDKTRPASVSVMVFSEPNPALVNRERNAAIISAAAEAVQRGESEISADMARRVLFPQCNPAHGGSGSREMLPVTGTEAQVLFDDRTFFQLKVKPEYLTMGYLPEPALMAPVYFPVWSDKALRLGAPEECALRPPADNRVGSADIVKWIPSAEAAAEPVILTKLRESALNNMNSAAETDSIPVLAGQESLPIPPISTAPSSSSGKEDSTQAIVEAMPAWLTSGEDYWEEYDVDFLHHTPGLRVFGALPRRSELDVDWTLRPDSEALAYEHDTSLRSMWCGKPGFQSANIYLLAGHESRNRDPPQPSGPNLSSDYYAPDNDRHRSGLSCYAHDHLRGPLEHDSDVAPLQQAQDRRDYLTDSESDDEGGYGDFRPSLERVRRILYSPPPATKALDSAPATAKGGKDAKKGSAAPAAAPMIATPAAPLTADTVQIDAFSTLLEEGQRKEEQVELLRDRKTLDLESTILRARKTKFDEFAKKLCGVSAQSSCLLQALTVQLPFHSYEDEVYCLVEPRMPALSQVHVEIDLSRSNDSLPNMSLNLSPTKTM